MSIGKHISSGANYFTTSGGGMCIVITLLQLCGKQKYFYEFFGDWRSEQKSL